MTAPSWPDLARVFARIGVLSFGGPAAQIALAAVQQMQTATQPRLGMSLGVSA